MKDFVKISQQMRNAENRYQNEENEEAQPYLITKKLLLNFVCRTERIPYHMHASILAYFNERCPVGSFLTAVLSNDFMEAAGRADETNVKCLHVYAAFLYNYAPGNSYGSPENVRNWLAQRSDNENTD